MDDAREALLSAIRDFGAESVRTVWLFDQTTHERLYTRDDMFSTLADLDVGKLIDNERYGYVTGDIYETLYETEHVYTVRGFESFTLFRTFFDDGTQRVGLLVDLDLQEDCYDFDILAETTRQAVADYPFDALQPE